MLQLLNQLVAKIYAIYTNGHEAKRANLDIAKGFEAELLLAKRLHIMLMANLQTEAGLVNEIMRIIEDILFEKQELLSLLVAVFIKFDIYERTIITTLEGEKVILIVLVKCT